MLRETCNVYLVMTLSSDFLNSCMDHYIHISTSPANRSCERHLMHVVWFGTYIVSPSSDDVAIKRVWIRNWIYWTSKFLIYTSLWRYRKFLESTVAYGKHWVFPACFTSPLVPGSNGRSTPSWVPELSPCHSHKQILTRSPLTISIAPAPLYTLNLF
jgi:hypothetical protein